MHNEIEPIMAAQACTPNGGLVVMTDAFLLTHRAEIAALAVRYRPRFGMGRLFCRT
ncbi:MAG TPA: hypothetical protein VFX14_06305 [Methylomirabilota bacterium]|nr:hypothetical protein [Methylomirabilota bacterium]